MNLFSNLSSDQQRIFVLIGVGVVAVLGLFVLTRGGGSESSSTPSSPPTQTSPAKPDSSKTDPSQTDPSGGSQQKSDGSSKSTPDDKSSSAVKPSKQAYLDCVEQAADTAALEKCQAVLP